jgi:beta-galactosidase
MAINSRSRTSLDVGWKFKLADAELLKPYERWLNSGGFLVGAPSRAWDDSGWSEVNLPHDFVIQGGFIPGEPVEYNNGDLYPSRGSRPVGVGWYRKHFQVAASDAPKRIYLYFDGAFRDSKVYLNQYWVGGCASGYSSFFFDVTDMINFGGENLLAVRVDATQPEGWFYEGGGIYRHVWMISTAPTHIAPDGTFVTAKIDFNGAHPLAELTIQADLLNQSPAAAVGKLTSTILDPEGKVVGEVTEDFSMAAWGKTLMTQTAPLAEARLWSLAEPNLYKVVSTIWIDGNSVDQYETTTGIRSIRFDANEGFFLNQQPVKIQGVCCHQDHAGVGSAFPDRLHSFRLEHLKQMGCNAYRCSHHPPAPELLDACDRLGMLVMDEKRRLSSAADDQAELERILRRDRNHPSVILWSLGNEEVFMQWSPQAERIAQTLQDLVHRLDSTRPVTLAICLWNPAANTEEDLSHTPTPAAILDVMGFNYAVGTWEKYHQLHPNQPIVVSEASTNFRTRSCFQTNEDTCHLAWDDPRAEHRAEEQWAKVARYPYLSGIFLWTGFDYHGEPAPFNWPAASSQFGLMDLCGFPKDNYYYYQAAWRPEPLVHIFPHWDLPDQVGQPVKVGCYTNCAEVELFLNGRSLGRKQAMRNDHLEWADVIYEPGRLEAKGYLDGKVAASACVETTGPAQSIRLLPDRSSIAASRNDICVVDVEIVDAQGRVVPTADPQVFFTISGPGQIIGVGNGDPSSHEPEHASQRRAFHGRCQAILQPVEQTGGSIQFGAHTEGLHSAEITIQLTPSLIPG